MTAANPFRIGPSDIRWSLPGREDVLDRLVRSVRERGRRVVVHGRRRIGKTCLLTQAGAIAGSVWLSVDLSKAADLRDVAQKLLLAFGPIPARKVATLVQVLQKYPTLSLAGGKFELRGRSMGTLEQVLDFINEQAALNDTRTTVAFDEFQEIRALDGDRAEWMLRAIIQKHKHVSYVFCGSSSRVRSWMSEPKSAFFKQLETIHIGPIDRGHMANWIDERAHRGGLTRFDHGAAIVAAVGPATGDIVRLAKLVFEFEAENRKGNLVDVALAEIALHELDDKYTEQWRSLTRPMRMVLRALADRRQPFAADTLQEMGIKAASTASKAAARLVAREIILRERDGLEFTSPYFRYWVVQNSSSRT